MGNKDHWENVFGTKNSTEVSWTQEYPHAIMDFLKFLRLPKSARIIDVGGGEGHLAEALLAEGYQNVWVLDISETALDKARKRLGNKSTLIQWIVSDITAFDTDQKFDFVNDRAVFHFLTDTKSIDKYISTVEKVLNENGHFLLGTFSKTGPLKCSGLEIKQYDETQMKNVFKKGFEAVKCFTEDHKTPFNTIQNFQFCGFKKIETT